MTATATMLPRGESTADAPGTISRATALIPSQASVVSHPALPLRVLAEDEYINTLSGVIQRDFFPLADTHVNDTHTADHRTDSDRHLPLSLGQFLANYTSEDNASFMRLEATLAQQRQQKRARQLRAIEREASDIDAQSLLLESAKNPVMFCIDVPKPSIDAVNAEAKKRKIVYQNTRFQPPLLSDTAASDSHSELAASSVRGLLVNGFGFISSPAPTPFVAASSAATGFLSPQPAPVRRGFHLQPTPKREALVMRMTQKKRQLQQRHSTSSLLRSPLTPNTAQLSAAAVKILSSATPRPSASRASPGSGTPMPPLSPGPGTPR